ncbi:hypothetical protein C7S14_2175 [Burkholderia cepacia]|nr:hypothetical protein C7S14_2175 [Burkholderia cepacia]
MPVGERPGGARDCTVSVGYMADSEGGRARAVFAALRASVVGTAPPVKSAEKGECHHSRK